MSTPVLHWAMAWRFRAALISGLLVSIFGALSLAPTVSNASAATKATSPTTSSTRMASPFSLSATVTNPKTGEVTKITKGKKLSKQKALRLVRRTGWSWSWTWRVVKCTGGGAASFFQWWFLPPWVRAGQVVAGCLVTQR